jgi:hypothetical protein
VSVTDLSEWGREERERRESIEREERGRQKGERDRELGGRK